LQQLQKEAEAREKDIGEMKFQLEQKSLELHEVQAGRLKAEEQLKKMAEDTKKGAVRREVVLEKDAELSKLQSEVSHLQHELRNMQSASETQAERLEAKGMELAQELDAAEKKNRRMERKLRTSESEKQDSTVNAGVVAEYEAKLKDCKTHIARLLENELELHALKESKEHTLKPSRVSILSAQVDHQEAALKECLKNAKDLLADVKGEAKLENKVEVLIDMLSPPSAKTSSSEMRNFAECLAMESLIIGQIAASSLKNSGTSSGLEALLKHISQTQLELKNLDRIVSQPSKSSQSQSAAESIETFANVLADKLMKVTNFSLKMAEEASSISMEPAELSTSRFSDAVNLLSSVNMKMASSSLALSDRAMVQSQLASQLSRLQDQLSSSQDSMSNVASFYKLLLQSEQETAEKGSTYMEEKTVQLAKLMVLCSNSDLPDVREWTQETLHEELSHSAQCCMEKHVSAMLRDSDLDSEDTLRVIRESISSDTDALVQDIMQTADQLASEEMELDLGNLSMFEGSEVDDEMRAQRLERERAKCTSSWKTC
jgi:hypothetical protein